MKYNTSAKLTVRGIPEMSAGRRRGLVSWLVKQAQFIGKNHSKVSRRYTARLLYGAKAK